MTGLEPANLPRTDGAAWARARVDGRLKARHDERGGGSSFDDEAAPPAVSRPGFGRRVLLAALAAPPGGDALARVMTALAAVPHRDALFTETKTLAALRAPLRSSGRLTYTRPDRFAKITEWPRAEVLTVTGGHAALSLDGGPARRLSFSDQPALAGLAAAILGTLSGNLVLLRRWYHVRLSGDLGGWRLALTPRGKGLAGFVRAVSLRGIGGHIREVRTVAANGDRSVMQIDAGQ